MKNLIKKLKTLFKRIASFFNYLYKPVFVIVSIIICYFIYGYTVIYWNKLNRENIVENYKFKEERLISMEKNIFEFSNYISMVFTRLDYFISAECNNPDGFINSFGEGLNSKVDSISSLLISRFVFGEEVFTEYRKMFSAYTYFYNANGDIYKSLLFKNYNCNDLRTQLEKLRTLKDNFRNSYETWGKTIMEDKDLISISQKGKKIVNLFNL